MNGSMITLGCIMAEVSEHESGDITSTTEGDVKLTFCFTSESEGNRIIVTPQMSQPPAKKIDRPALFHRGNRQIRSI
jgi:hypothetical protein